MKIANVFFGFALASGCSPGETGELRIESVPSVLSPEQNQTPGAETTIERAQIGVSEIELEGGADDEREASMGDGVIDVVLGGNPTTVAVDSVEAGSYHTLGIELKTITVEGTHAGAPFTFTSNIEPEVEFGLDPEVDVPAKGSASAGVSFDVPAWFRDADGNALDPNDAANQAAIESSILRSMAVNAVIEDETNDD